jgi:hypothetical protein
MGLISPRSDMLAFRTDRDLRISHNSSQVPGTLLEMRIRCTHSYALRLQFQQDIPAALPPPARRQRDRSPDAAQRGSSCNAGP